MKKNLKFAFLSGLLVAFAPQAITETLSDFENGNDGWRFSPGGEYAGAKGSAEVVNVGDAGVLKLEGDFSEGGKYVAAFKSVEPGRMANSLKLKVKASGGIRYILVRLRDSDNQVHQHRCNLESTAGWQVVEISDFGSAIHWGGANDGKFHQSLSEVGILIEKDAFTGDAGSVEVDFVTLANE